MRTILCLPTALLACALTTASCATYRPEPARPPRLTLPDAAAESCPLPTLPADPTLGDLEAGYIARGAALVACDGARRLAVDTREAEHQLIDEWVKLEQQRRGGSSWLF